LSGASREAGGGNRRLRGIHKGNEIRTGLTMRIWGLYDSADNDDQLTQPISARDIKGIRRAEMAGNDPKMASPSRFPVLLMVILSLARCHNGAITRLTAPTRRRKELCQRARRGARLRLVVGGTPLSWPWKPTAGVLFVGSRQRFLKLCAHGGMEPALAASSPVPVALPT
jgi:hypothetical protein